MTNDLTAKLLGDPRYRDDAIQDALEQVAAADRELARIAEDETAISRKERYRMVRLGKKIRHKALPNDYQANQ
jgi:hypothetical protein